MIRLATVFSGIGAIEHALQRMELEHKIVFACDNGDVDILSKKVDVDISEITKEIEILCNEINKIEVRSEKDSDYKFQLIFDLDKIKLELKDSDKKLMNKALEKLLPMALSLLDNILEMQNIKHKKYKEYLEINNRLKRKQTISSKIFEVLKLIQKIINDFKKDNDLELMNEEVLGTYKSSDNIEWNVIIEKVKYLKIIFDNCEAKLIIKGVKDISERLGMLHEKINSFSILKRLSKIDGYKEKKKYVDELYKGKDSQNKVKQSYLANYNINEEDFHWNVSFLDGKQYKDKVDLFVGGSPCQSFSLVGKQRGLEDTRGTLFYEYARLVDEIRPKVFIYENVKALLSNDEGRTWQTVKQVFTDLNYVWDYKVLNAKDYGIPQNRERVFVVGFRNDLKLNKKFDFPMPIKLEKTMQDFLLENVSGKYYLNKKGVDFVTSEKNISRRYTQIDGVIQLCQKKNQQFNWHGDFIFEEENDNKKKTMKDLEKYFLSEKVKKYVLSTGTKGFYSKPKTDLEIARPLLTTMHKMHRAGVDNYVTTDGRLRKLAPRECLRLMGFCDSFKIVVSDTAMYQQAGNSIVVDVLIHIVKEIQKVYPKMI